MDFCNDKLFRKAIATTLADNLFSTSKKKCNPDVVLGWYNQYIDNRINMSGVCSCNVDVNALPGITAFKDCHFLGHDLPVWYTDGGEKGVSDTIIHNDKSLSETNRNRVMVIGQDPLRNVLTPGCISLMSPWGLHYPAYFKQKHGKVYKHIVDPLIKEKDIYVTDYWKIYACDSLRTALSLGRFHFDTILKDEIEAFKPNSILILSSDENKYIDICRDIDSNINTSLKIKSVTMLNIDNFSIGESITSGDGTIKVVCATHPNGVRASGIEKFYEKVISLL